ncbi:glycosyltransferase [Heliobacterium gestii]|uniref:Glycosyltransferase n=1 Tax=Heliomicrobium gestii TaxID=2699 RepID=A0A845LJQ2_HELGE|nr:glycosyltransferase family 2 protein [Heliomicrobium gestii]MBM7866624.1 dolichol-phosphate mannosyltransferase [Heliomicrobium gestii]MZP43096.1 glycosyltransferase [Heliomicrobium gestii]
MKKLSIIIPVYYNEGSLPYLYDELVEIEKELNKLELELELIFVDDGSTDRSLQELMTIKLKREKTKIIKLSRNFGAVHASKTGYRFVTGDCFIVLAADLQDPPELILKMVRKWLEGHKYVIAVREARQDPFLTTLFARFYYRVLRKIVYKDFPKGGFDVALMDKAFLPYMQKCAKNINPSLYSYSLGFKPCVLEYTRRERKYGKSRWTFLKKLKFFIDSILGFSIVPIRFMSIGGITVSFLSCIYGTLIVVSALFGEKDVPGFATLASLMAFLLGIIMFMLGIIGEYLWRVFDEVNNRPESVIDEIY